MAFKSTFDPTSGRIKILTRLSFCKVFEKTASIQNGKLKYRTNGLLDKNSEDGKSAIIAVNQATKSIIETEWKGKEWKRFLETLKDDRRPLMDGDKYMDPKTDEVRDGYEGQRFIKLTSDRKVKLRDRRGNELEEAEAKELFLSGYWAVAYAHLYTVKGAEKGGNGIFATLDGLQFFKRDEEFSGGGMDDDEFDNLGDDEDDDLGGGSKGASIDDDDIPF